MDGRGIICEVILVVAIEESEAHTGCVIMITDGGVSMMARLGVGNSLALSLGLISTEHTLSVS